MENNLCYSLFKKWKQEQTTAVDKTWCLCKTHHLFCFSVRTKLGILYYLPLHKTSYFLFSAWLISCMFADETLKLLKELTSRKSLQVPNIYYHLPHLLKNEGSLQPSVQVGLGRTGGMMIRCLFYVLYLEDLLVLVI